LFAAVMLLLVASFRERRRAEEESGLRAVSRLIREGDRYYAHGKGLTGTRVEISRAQYDAYQRHDAVAQRLLVAGVVVVFAAVFIGVGVELHRYFRSPKGGSYRR
jgi:hypothetical protein